MLVLRSFLRRGHALGLALIVSALVLVLAMPGVVSRAADPTDAAGVISATAAIFTAFPILTIAVVAFAIAGLAMMLIARGKRAVR